MEVSMKTIKIIKAWRYPCEDVFDIWKGRESRVYIDIDINVYQTKKQLGKFYPDCHCGKNCKPEKIKITVERC